MMEKNLWQHKPSSVKLFLHLIDAFKEDLALTQSNTLLLQDTLIKHGQNLWLEAVSHAQLTLNFDDRPLYWTRLYMNHELRIWLIRQARSHSIRRSYFYLLNLFDKASRGLIEKPSLNNEKLVVISGFDPFGLINTYEKGNSSGACILALQHQILLSGGISAKVIGVIFPVRYADFDKGIVEAFFSSYLNSSHKADMIMTISQNRDGFKVERYAGRRRSSKLFADNSGCISGGSRLHPIEPPDLQAGPEFIESSLPAAIIRSSFGRNEPLKNEVRFIEQNKGTEPEWQYTTPTKGTLSVCGSGGGFLSNEIFYRSSLLRLQSDRKNLPMGHIHIPALADNNDSTQRNQIVNTMKKAIIATLPYL